MEDITESEKFAIQEEVIQKKVLEIIESHLKNNDFQEEKVSQWISNICESCMEELYAPRKPFKYVVTCAIMQRTGDAIYSANSCFWDTVGDAAITVSWPKRHTAKDPHNRTMLCMVTVYCISFYPSH